jgi:hypothetical protein
VGEAASEKLSKYDEASQETVVEVTDRFDVCSYYVAQIGVVLAENGLSRKIWAYPELAAI